MNEPALIRSDEQIWIPDLNIRFQRLGSYPERWGDRFYWVSLTAIDSGRLADLKEILRQYQIEYQATVLNCLICTEFVGELPHASGPRD